MPLMILERMGEVKKIIVIGDYADENDRGTLEIVGLVKSDDYVLILEALGCVLNVQKRAMIESLRI